MEAALRAHKTTFAHVQRQQARANPRQKPLDLNQVLITALNEPLSFTATPKCCLKARL